MINVSFYDRCDTADEEIRYAVVAARYEGKWIFCRHRSRTTWELPGGHREEGETPDQTAGRELREETGANVFDLYPVCVYSLSGKMTGTGMLFFAQVHELGAMPPMEIAEIAPGERMPAPEHCTYPQIQPLLFNRVQEWLCTSMNADELWDVYDDERRLTGRTIHRGDILGKGERHLCVHMWIMAPDGRFLLTRRAPQKGYAGMWECPGGSALSGEDSLSAALREISEETGLSADPESGHVVLSLKREHDFCDIWLFRHNFSLEDIVFQEGETCGAMLATADEVISMREQGELIPFQYLEELFDKTGASGGGA